MSVVAWPVEDVDLRHGFTLAQVNRLTVFAVQRQRWYQESDFEERVAIAWSAIVEHLYAQQDPPTISDVIKVAWRAIGHEIDRDRRSRGLNAHDRYAGVTAAFESYWRSAAQPAPGVEDAVVERTALWQIWQRLSPTHKAVLAALAMHDDHPRAAAALGKPITSYTSMLSVARRAFLELWHEHEVPSRPWGTDRRKVPANNNRHSPTSVIKVRERHRARQATKADAPAGPGKGRKPADLGISTEELAWRYHRGESIRQIAASLGLSYSVVQRRLQAEGIQARPGGARPRNGRAAKDLGISVAELARRYRQGESLRTLSKSLGVNVKLIQRRLRAAGVQIRGAGWPGRT